MSTSNVLERKKKEKKNTTQVPGPNYNSITNVYKKKKKPIEHELYRDVYTKTDPSTVVVLGRYNCSRRTFRPRSVSKKKKKPTINLETKKKKNRLVTNTRLRVNVAFNQCVTKTVSY